MARKAGFYGECQVCGNIQKLPGDKLSLHGYEVKWHMFVGDCWGSKCLPFEQDRQVAIRARDNAVNRRADLLATVKSLRVMATEPTYWIMVDRNEKGLPSWKRNQNLVNKELVTFRLGTATRRGDITREEIIGVAKDGFEQPLSGGFYGKTPLEAAQFYRERDADECERDARSMVSYIDWQSARIAAWEPKELKPVEAVVAEEKAAKDARKAEKQALRVAKLEKKAEHYRKQIAKYEKMVPAEVRNSLKGMDRRAMYEIHNNYPTQVGDTMVAEWEAVNEPGQRGIYDNPYAMLQKTITAIENEVKG